MPSEKKIYQDLDKYFDSVVGSFSSGLDPILKTARANTLKALSAKLKMSDGLIDKSSANQRVLRTIDTIFQREMRKAGYDTLAKAFSDQFSDHLPQFQETLQLLSESMDEPLPAFSFNSADRDVFASQALNAQEQLLDVVASAATAAKRQALFSVGGLSFGDLTASLVHQFDKTLGQAKTLAETSITTFWRTVNAQAFEHIQADTKQKLKYRYAGPDDQKTRVFCEKMLHRTAVKPMTRAEIDHLDNGQIPNVWISCGGFSCRHQWLLSTADLESRLKAAQ